MPIKVPNNLPAIDILSQENVFVMTDTRAMTQDIRPLKILLLNLMPTKIVTETQLTRLLGNTPIQIELELLQTASHKASHTSQEHMISFYKTFDQVRDNNYDGMIITGAPIELMDFEEVDYWDELCEIMEWTKSHVHSTFHICWGAQAGLYYHYGIQKHIMDKKLSGVYKHHLDYKKGMLFRGFDDEFWVPHSRNTTVRREDIEAVPGLKILASSDEAGVFCVKSDDDRQIFVTGHSEYDGDTLKKEYERDVKAGLNPDIPDHYFPNDDPSQEPVVNWRSCANLIYSNWLNYFVYQSTPYDIKAIQNEDLAPVLQRKSNLTVAKFGGTSLAGSEQFSQVKKILQEDPARKYAVVSAPGKRFDEDEKVTDLLIQAAEEESSSARDQLLDQVEKRIWEIASAAAPGLNLDQEIAAVKVEADKLKGRELRDYMASRGEYLSAKMLAEYTGRTFVDAADVIRFSEDNELDRAETRKLLSDRLKDLDGAVIPGFYGAKKDGTIVTFSRGGSDITGALAAAALKADVYENWTDVPGMLMADPRIVKNPLTVPVINYKELRELALRGANVLHEDAVAPVRRTGIPINIRSTAEPELNGTLIVQNADFYDSVLDISGISGRKGYAAIVIEKEGIGKNGGIHQALMDVLESRGISVAGEQIGTDTIAVEVEARPIRDNTDELTNVIQQVTGAEDVTVSAGLATIAVVGRNMADKSSVAVKVFEALSNEHIVTRFVDHSADSISIQLGVSETDYKKAIRAIYRQFSLIH